MMVSVHIARFFLLEIVIPVTFCNDWTLHDFSVTLPPPLQNEFPTKCFKDLGCFETGEPFYHPIYRPVSLLPFDEEHISTRFLLFTRNNPTEPQLLDPDCRNIRNSSFNPYCPTKIIIHGFTVNPTEGKEYATMKNVLLQRGSFNVIIVDWSDSNQTPYFQAFANGRVVGAQVARLIYALQFFTGARAEDFHIIGHSLGAAVAGWAGERIQNLGRITGLDPAGMYFYDAPPAVRLDTSDATFVDTIITNGGYKLEDGIATLEPIGHVNFYPNGGSVQPGCYNSSEELNEIDFNRNLCSHFRSLFLYVTSIFNDRCRFMATQCDDYQSFLSGKCSDNRFWWRRSFGHSLYSKKLEMGFNAKMTYNYNYNYGFPPVGQKYYLNTSADPPFCAEENKNRRPVSSVKY